MAENERQIGAFLDAHPDFAAIDLQAALPAWAHPARRATSCSRSARRRAATASSSRRCARRLSDERGRPSSGRAARNCGEPWLRPTNLPGRYRCVYCLHRFELVSVCPNCGEHSTIVRMASTAIVMCNVCGGSMLREI